MLLFLLVLAPLRCVNLYISSNNITTLTTAVAGSNVTISLTATQTAAISPGNYPYDVEYTQSDTVTVERVAEGIITVYGEATK